VTVCVVVGVVSTVDATASTEDVIVSIFVIVVVDVATGIVYPRRLLQNGW
jgi:hypothetical protein